MGRKFGFSFSWKRAAGISSAKQRIARATGIPTTKEGRRRKFGPFGLWLLFGGNKTPQPLAPSQPLPASRNEPSTLASFAILALVGFGFYAWVGGCGSDKPVANLADQQQRKDERPAVPPTNQTNPAAVPAPSVAAQGHNAADDSMDEKMAEYEAAKAEYHAAEKLRLARQLKVLALKADADGDTQKAAKLTTGVDSWYRSIVQFYPETAAAVDAQKLLDGEEVAERPVPSRPSLPDGVKAQTIDLADRAAKKAAGERVVAGATNSESYSGPAGYSTSGGTKSVHVRGYTRKDGAYVQPHSRAASGSGGGRRR